MADSTLAVQGLAGLQRAFALADRELKLELTNSLKEAGEPVRADAETLASGRILGIDAGDPWSKMRIGVTKSLVYVAPKRRGTRDQKRKRRNLAGLLMDGAMLPALDQNAVEVERRVDKLLGQIGRDWERV